MLLIIYYKNDDKHKHFTMEIHQKVKIFKRKIANDRLYAKYLENVLS